MNSLGRIRERFRSAHPDHYDIARGMAWVALFVFLGKLAGAAKEMAIAWRYGIGAEVDAYLFIFNLVNWPVGLWYSVLTIVLVPLAAHVRQQAPAELPRFRAELLGFTLLLGLALTPLIWLGLTLLLRSSWTGLHPATVTIATGMVPALAFLFPLGVLISLFSAWMLSAGQHVNTLLDGVPALAIVIGLLVFSGGGTEPLVWCTVAGFVFHFASLAISSGWCDGVEARFGRHSPHWPAFWHGFGIMLAGQMLMSLIGIIDQFFAAHLDTGAITILSYANRILALILGLGAIAIGRATLSVFSRARAQGGEQVYRVAGHWLRLLFALGVTAMIIGWWLAPWAVKLLFERGAFTASDTEVVAEVLRFGLLQLPFYFAGLVLVSLLASYRKHKLIAIGAGINLIVKIGANYVFIPPMGVNGIILATAVMYMGSFTVLYIFTHVLAKRREIL